MKPIRLLQFSPNCSKVPVSSLLTVTPLKVSGVNHVVPSSTAINSRNSNEDDSERKSRGKDNDNKNSKCKGQGKQKDKGKVRQKYCISDDMMGVFGLQKGGGSEELVKKTEIYHLRELIKSAKWAIGLAEQDEDGVEQSVWDVKRVIQETFEQLYSSLKQRQVSLYDELQVKLMQMKQKNNTKRLQLSYLRNYVRKCQQDINTNYESIIKDLSYEKLSQIVSQYKYQIQTYVNHVQTQFSIKFRSPINGQCNNFVNDFKVSLEYDFSQNQFESTFDKQNVCDNLIQLKLNVNKNGQKSLQKHTKNIHSNFEQNHNINKIKMKKMIGQQPRISSARGKY